MLLASRIDLATGSRINVIWFLVGRLKPGATVGQAQAQVDAVATDLRKRFPIKETAGVYYQVTPLRAEIASDVKPALLALMGAVFFVLLIACANVANLLLVRTSRRERELAVRAAFGGSRGRLVRQMLAEALVLSTGGALLGLGVAKVGDRRAHGDRAAGPPAYRRRRSRRQRARLHRASPRSSAASLFGIIPALRASRPNVMGILRQAGRTRTRRREVPAQRRRDGRGGAGVRAAHRWRSHVPQLPRAHEHRSRASIRAACSPSVSRTLARRQSTRAPRTSGRCMTGSPRSRASRRSPRSPRCRSTGNRSTCAGGPKRRCVTRRPSARPTPTSCFPATSRR